MVVKKSSSIKNIHKLVLSPPLNTIVLDSFTETFESEYGALLADADIKHKVNLDFKWLNSYVHSYIPNNELFIIVVYEGSRMIGCLPLFKASVRATRFWNYRILKIIGNGPTDFFSIISLNNKEEVVISEITECLIKNHGWDKLELTEVPENHPGFTLFKDKLLSRNLKCLIDYPNGYYFINTSNRPWGDYKNEFDNKNKDLAKAERRLIKDNINLQIKTYKKDIYPRLIESINLYEERRKSLGQTNTYETHERNVFLKSVISEREKYGGVELNQLMDTDENVWAFQLDWIDDRIRYHWNHAYNELYKRYSPGKYLLKEIMKSSFADEQIDECNYMRGLSDYKSKLVDEKGMFGRLILENPKSIRLKSTRLISKFFRIIRR